ncbi:MAG: hypothetical protein AAF725_18630, partial [Acidobacteriota bacterium]
MRLAFVLTSIQPLRALEPGPVSLEWLLALSQEHSVELFLDQASAASDALRRSGVPTHVSIKRSVEFLDGETVSADAFQAMALLRAHRANSFDAVIYGGELTCDLAWFEPDLRTIPRGVVLGAGLAQDLPAAWEDRRLFLSQARRVWSHTGLLASADFILSDLPAEAFGLTDDGVLPPRYTVEGGLQESAVLDRLASGPHPEPASAAPRSIAVAATFLGIRRLERLFDSLLERFPPTPSTTYAVLVRPRCSLGVPAEEALLQHCPPDLRRQVVLVAAGEDEIAADFLEAADVIAAASPAELALAAVSRAAAQKPLVVLADEGFLQRRGSEPAGLFPRQRPVKRRRRAEAARALHVLTWEEPPARFAQALEALGSDLAGDEMVVIHASGRIGPAANLFQQAGLNGVDLAVWGRPEGVFMQPEPSFVYPFALAIRGAMVGATARAIRDCDSIWQLICWALSG